MVCYDVQVEPELARGANQAPDSCLDVHSTGSWERQRAAFFHKGCAIPMRTLIEMLVPSKCTGFMKMRRGENTILASQN